MAVQETTAPIEDAGMLSEIMAETRETETTTEPEQPAAPEPRVDETGRLHGERGRFVSKQANEPDAAPIQQQAPETPEAPQPTADDKADQPPSWRLREMREARDAANQKAEENARQLYAYQQQLQDAQRQLAELNKPKPQPVDFFENPDGALQQRVEPIQQGFERQISEMRLDMSRELAVTRHGEQAVAEMETAIAQAMQRNDPDMATLAAQMRSSKFPALKAMEWHQQAKLRSEVGNDLNAYKTKLQEQLLGDPEFLAKAVAKATGQAQQAAAQPGARLPISLPPSLNRATGSGSNSQGEDEDMSDRALFRHAAAPGRR